MAVQPGGATIALLIIRMKRLLHQLIGPVLLLACAATASAQTDGKFAVGLNVSLKDGMDSGWNRSYQPWVALALRAWR